MAEELFIDSSLTKDQKYESLLPQIEALITGEPNLIANLANICSVLRYGFDFFWVGFYLNTGKDLVLGPFQGPIACTRIPYTKGVCGHSFTTKQTVIVDNVDEFPGHIACSSASKSEIVVPIFNAKNEIEIILDIDSDQLSSFDTTDQVYLEKLAKLISNTLPV